MSSNLTASAKTSMNTGLSARFSFLASVLQATGAKLRSTVCGTAKNVHAVAQISGSATTALGARAMTNIRGNVGMNIDVSVSNAQFNGPVVHQAAR